MVSLLYWWKDPFNLIVELPKFYISLLESATSIEAVILGEGKGMELSLKLALLLLKLIAPARDSFCYLLELIACV